MIETELQHKEIMPFFCKPEESGGLGYRETEPNIVSDDLFIPSQLAEFVKSADSLTWKALLSKYHGSEQELALALKNAIKDGILESSNVAVWLNTHKTITFEGETVPLYYVSGTELGGDADFKKNIFAAVEEMPHKIRCDGVTLQTIRPDITFFLNGIFIGYMELKSITNGQTATTQGRGKVIGDYLESVKGMATRAKAHPAAFGGTGHLVRAELATLKRQIEVYNEQHPDAKILGIGEAKRMELAAAFELVRREYAGRDDDERKLDVSKVENRYRIFRRVLRPEDRQENFCVLVLDTKMHPLTDPFVVFRGTMDRTTVHPREIFQEAVRWGAHAVMVAHNHPSGDPQPGKADIEMTKQLVEASKIMGIPLLDHLVLGAVDAADGTGYVSMRESGLVNFK